MRVFREAFAALVFVSCGGPAATPATPPGTGASAMPRSSEPPVAHTDDRGATSDAGLGSAVPGEPQAEAPSATPVPSATETAPPPARLGTVRGIIKTQPAQSAQHAVVYLDNGAVKSVVDARLDDHKMTFFPYVSVMTVGGTLTYVNSEPFPDTAYSTSNEKWDFGMVESRGVRKRKFENAGIYTILCRLHPNQLAFLVVSPSSFVARADKKGEFVIPEVPAGTYEVVAWAPRVKTERKSVTVGEGEASIDFELKR